MTKQSLLEMTETQMANRSLPMRALWYAAQDHWDAAHQLVQSDSSRECAWIHAYLHRVEGDLSNASYWYRQAGKTPPFKLSLEQELEEIIAALSL